MKLSLVMTLLSFTNHLQAADPINAGGSNYAWYSIDKSVINTNGDKNCRENFGIIANYHRHNVRRTVNQQLMSMFNNGQRRLRIPIYHASDLSTATVLRSTGGNLTLQARDNLALFLQDIKTSGFEEIIVGFFPIGLSSPKNWYREYGTGNSSSKTPYYNTSIMQENWQLIQNLRPIITAVDLSYKIDLRNEGAAASNQAIDRQYASDIWSLYNAAFGKKDTVGFSVATGTLAERTNPDLSTIGDLAVDRYNVMKQVYAESGYGDPVVWDFHAYQYLATKFTKVDAAMKARGDTTDVIIGETFYQDVDTLSAIRNLNLTRSILAVYAWPVTTERGCDGHVDTAFPDEYIYAPRQPATEESAADTTSETEQQTMASEATATNTEHSISACTSSAIDPDGDGWGWENNESCRVVTYHVETSAPVTNSDVPICELPDTDSDGDGWGWENNHSCIFNESVYSLPANSTQGDRITTPVCVLTDSDIDGDGWGWENNASCLVR